MKQSIVSQSTFTPLTKAELKWLAKRTTSSCSRPTPESCHIFKYAAARELWGSFHHLETLIL